MSESSWLKISLDSSYFTAGERVTGEVMVFTKTSNTKILLKSLGTEKLSLKKPGSLVVHHSTQIFSLDVELMKIASETQAVFPFTFKLPSFSPASFSFADSDVELNNVMCEITYYIEAILIHNSNELQRDILPFVMLNKNSRLIISPHIDFTSTLTACWCFQRGISTISIEPMDMNHISCKDQKKYRIIINSQSNQTLASIIGQVVYEVKFIIPGEKTLQMRKIISRSVPNIDSLKRDAPDINSIVYIFETDLSAINIGDNPCSNKSSMCFSEYKLQVFAVYDVGCRSKRAECEIPLQVNPKKSKNEKPEPPSFWEPIEHSLKSFILSTDHSDPESYSQNNININFPQTPDDF
ncbi:hypothetical protein SteCoe_21802 [Stentor coeruleus]|uniref:Arrestin-like N-terminal domain-containing protein n=1 Tax=Stentor coeruleus TaxID=5963 RepID=A0A1R2BNM4_9CILI|nr:hypothetical protein SteCoe_21802 [Stentor coeruleus]